jgi:sugar phosphate isomerase/epimerase
MSFDDRFCLNQGCFAPDLDFHTFVRASASVGAAWVGLWSDRLSGLAATDVAQLLSDNGMRISAVNRGGFFASDLSAGMTDTIDHTRRQVDFCADVGAKVLLVVPGGLPPGTKDIQSARSRFEDGFARSLEHARAAGVTLAIEPFHPALTAIRGVINRLRDATAICRRVGPGAEVIIDVYHLWWDPEVYEDIKSAADYIAGYHLCDYQQNPRDLVFDRALAGDGIADTLSLTAATLAAGYKGPLEVEVFSKFDLWGRDPFETAKICRANFDGHLRSLHSGSARE